MEQPSLFDQEREQAASRQYWVHRVDAKFLRLVAMRKFLGSKSTRARNVREVRVGDAILLATTLMVPRESLPPTRRIGFVGAGQVERVLEEPHPLVGYDQHRTKLQLRALRFFVRPLFLDEAAELGLQFLSGKKKTSDAMDFDYRAISEDDFRRVVDRQTLIEAVPEYLSEAGSGREVRLSEAQLVQVFKLVRETMRVVLRPRDQIEIKVFLRAVAGVLEGAGVEAGYEAVYQEYRRLAHKLGFRHSPSRDPDLQVELLDERGRPQRFGLISLR